MNRPHQRMDKNLTQIKEEVYDKLALEMSNFRLELESKEYDACQFQLNSRNVVCRNAKVTPKKSGQFVTFWKRYKDSPIEPFSEKDAIDFFVVHVRTANNFGQFVFPKEVLIKKGILSTDKQEGKKAFRVYPSWDTPQSKQATQTQKWQLHYFYTLEDKVDVKKVMDLYQ